MKTQQTAAKVLVVDDERTICLALCEMLTQFGYEASYARSGDDALQMLSEVAYDVVVLDLEMPGMKGIDVLTAAKTSAPETAFIILTAYASTDTAITALRSGVVDYLRKPASLATIAQTVEKAVAAQQARQRQRQAMQLLHKAINTLQLSSVGVSNDTKGKDEDILQMETLVINQRKQTASYQKRPLNLTPIEYRLLSRLVQSPDTVLTYAELAQVSHEMAIDEAEARTLLRTHIYRLSRKLGDKETSPLQNIRGRGVILLSHRPGL